MLKTPHIDAIADHGTRFDNFHVASPVCMPNRASLLTGRYPTLHGLRYNGCRLPLKANTFIDSLSAAGYHTAAIGKSHLQPFTGLPPKGRTPDELSGRTEAWKPDNGDYANEESGRYEKDGRYIFETPYYGYQHVDMVTVHGDRCGGHYHQWFRENAPDWQALHDDANQLPHNYSCPQAYRTPIPEKLYPTAYVRDRAIDYLNSRRGDDQPFFAFVSFPDPHHPFNPPGKYWDMYSPDEFEVSLPYTSHKNPTKPMRWLYDNWKNGDGQTTPQSAMMLDEQQLKEAMALTAGMMAFVDDAVGGIVASLESSGHWDNTVICYNSDHGDYLGDFNMLLKGSLPFRSITRVPFIWSDPANRTASVTAALASTVDIAATVLDRAGLEPFNGNQGKSFKALVDNRESSNESMHDSASVATATSATSAATAATAATATSAADGGGPVHGTANNYSHATTGMDNRADTNTDTNADASVDASVDSRDCTSPRNELLIEYNDGGRRFGFDKPARVRALVTYNWRYTMYLDQNWGELYDLRNDPSETNNLWSDSNYSTVRAELAERLNHHLTAQMDESPLSDRLA